MSSRRRSSSPFGNRRPSSPFSSASSTSSFLNSSGRFIPRSCSTSGSSFHSSAKNGSANKRSYRSPTPDRSDSDTMLGGVSRSSSGHMPVGFSSTDDLLAELDAPPRSSAADSISVTIRFRPMNEREYQHGDESAWYPDGDKFVRSESNQAVAYAFDKVFNETAITDDVYEIAGRPVVKSAMDGVNGTVFAYGVTSSGKTHTMHGDHDSPGIIPMAIKDVFSIIQDTPGREFLLRVSYLEIYNEVINDLLDPTGQNLRIREDVQGTYVEGIKEEVVLSPGHALSFIASGEEHRHVGSNNFNLLSSRSHTIFTMMIESSARGDEYDGVVFSQLNLIDLAGSESSKTETTGLRRKEGAFINKSLLTLGTVIGKLSEGKASHVPYRDSKLTRMLQSSLSGKGHVSLICTITPASSSTEETHNTLKFASRAKRVEIHASRNKIIDEKSLIKKYQREISTLKDELDQLRQGVLVGVSHEEIISLRQKLEEGQVKMQSRLEEEEEAKSALLSRIQRLTKLILVSTKNAMPGYLGELPSRDRSHSAGEDDKPEVFKDGSLVGECENLKDSPSSAVLDPSGDSRHRRSSSKWTDDLSPSSSTITESNHTGELVSGSKVDVSDMTLSDEMELMVEQVKMLAGDIAFSSSSLKRLKEQSIHDPAASKTQIQNLEYEIQEKRNQMRILEQRIVRGGETSAANASVVDMQQTVARLMDQCNEKAFELELRTADNRILQEQLENKLVENKELQGKILVLEQQLASSSTGDQCSSPDISHMPNEHVEDLKRKIQSQEFENEKLELEHVQFQEENSGLRIQKQKLADEASYAKELASAAAIELKNLADEVTKLSIQNTKLEKELQAAHARYASTQGGGRKHNDGTQHGRKGRVSSRVNDNLYDDFDTYNLDPDDLKMELQARRQREAVLEAALAEKEIMEEEYRRIAEKAKKREASLENDLANMWVLVAKLKKETGGSIAEPHMHGNGEVMTDAKENCVEEKDVLKMANDSECTKPAPEDASLDESLVVHAHQQTSSEEPLVVPAYQETSTEEPLVATLKARMQQMREKEIKYQINGDANSHLCKVCFESATAAVLLPCRHFCLCKPCSFACSECPICRTSITDRIIAFTP